MNIITRVNISVTDIFCILFNFIHIYFYVLFQIKSIMYVYFNVILNCTKGLSLGKVSAEFEIGYIIDFNVTLSMFFNIRMNLLHSYIHFKFKFL